MKPVYTKTPLSLPAQVQHLQDKGLHVPDPARAQLILRRVGLYRFKGFLLPYKTPSGYVPGTAFADVERLMTLDDALRLHVLKAMQLRLLNDVQEWPEMQNPGAVFGARRRAA